jgi:RND superfamily putative drug exporter
MVNSEIAADDGASRRRFWMAMLGFFVAFGLAPFSVRVQQHLETAVHISGSEAEAVDTELAQRFHSPYAHRLVLVIQGLPDSDSASSAEVLTSLTTILSSLPGVSGAISSVDWPDPMFTGKHGGALVIVGLSAEGQALEALVPILREKTGSMVNQLRPKFPDIKIQITGETPLNFDLRKVSADDVNAAEAKVFPVTLVLLLLAFGSLVAALLPLGVGVLSISMTLGASALLAHYLHLSILLQNLATMLGLGLGIDYALLVVSRFREALASGNTPGRAADIAAGQAGRTLVLSAATVAIGFSALLTVPISELRSIGVAGLLVTATSIIMCTFILPWVLSLLGHRINAARVRLPARWSRQAGDVAAVGGGRWRQWGNIVTARPWISLLLAGVPTLVLAFQAHRIVTGLPANDWLPAKVESVHAGL